MSGTVVARPPGGPADIALGGSFADMERLAVAIAKSGLFGMKTPEQALVLMAISQAEGRHPALAARDYDIISGRPAKKAEAMLRDFFEGGGKVEWHTLTDENADATFSHPQGGSARINWNMERARTAGLTGKDNYKKFPRQMLRSRVVSEGVRTVWPLATSGLYVPEEVADMPRKEPPHPGPTLDGNAGALRAAAAAMPREARIAKLAPTYDAPIDRPRGPVVESPAPAPSAFSDEQWQASLTSLRGKAAGCTNRAQVAELGEDKKLAKALLAAPQWVQDEISDILADAYARFDATDSDWPGPDPEKMQA
jgi:hypothetical protein